MEDDLVLQESIYPDIQRALIIALAFREKVDYSSSNVILMNSVAV